MKPKETINYEGGQAFELTPKNKLVRMTSTYLFKEPKFYGKKDDQLVEINQLVGKIAKKDPQFLLKLAEYLRKEQYLRSISNYLLVAAANQKYLKGTSYIRTYSPQIIKRADELKEVMAMQLENFNKPIPNSLKKGINAAFKNFDEYQFAKYNRQNTNELVTYKDVIMLTHPKHPGNLIKKILDEDLNVPKTWETELSTKGNKPEIWEDLIDKQKIPYMATLRNLRNFLDAEISSKHIKKVADYISNKKAVKYSKQLPFRFLSAYLSIQTHNNPQTYKLLDAVEKACELSYENMPTLSGNTLIACDVSGSMYSPISRKSTVKQYQIGLLLGSAMSKYADGTTFGIFGNTWKPLNKPTSTPIISHVLNALNRMSEVGLSTDGWRVIDWAIKKNIKYDRFMFFSDNQMWCSERSFWGNEYEQENVLLSDDVKEAYEKFKEYKRKINKDAKLYIFDLGGYGKTSFPDEDPSVVGIGGWSDKVLKFIKTFERSPEQQVKYIEDNY